ncbi:MAG: O-antigen ligase family protein [Microcoleaceae cyanobacterium]
MKNTLTLPDSTTELNWIKWGILLLPFLPTLGCIITLIGVFLIWKNHYNIMIKNPLNQSLLLLSGLLILTAIFSPNPLDALLGAGNFIPYFIVFAAFSEVLKTPTQLKQFSWIIITPAIPIILLGFGQQFLGWSGGEAFQSILGWTLPLNGNPPGRMCSVFMYANILAAYLLLVFTLSTALLIEQLYLIQQTKKKKNIKILIFLLMVFSLTGIALIVTKSRNAWGLVIFIILAYAIYLGWRGLVGLILSAILAVLGAAFAPSPINQSLRYIVPAYFWQRLTDQNFERPIETLRVTQWKFAWNLTQQRPWTGWGLRSFTPLYEAKMNVWMGHPHNIFLMLTAEIGIPITLFLIGIIGFILSQFTHKIITKNINQSAHLTLFSYGVAFAVYILFNLADITLFDFRVNTFSWFILAGIWGNTQYFSKETGDRSQETGGTE